jgi:lipopolysaccharide/colanic/teichoic acid biosynthesis glycosyltransferase
MNYLKIKRALDFVIALFAFICALPIFLLVILLLWISNKKADVFFLQSRPGKNGKIFKVIKFKTMTDEKNVLGELLPDEKRMTKIGFFIRKTSLDETPQLLNVIIGNMSLVGPRPLLVEYLPLYNKTQMRRHEVKPGITGWAQVNGRNAISWEKKFELDVWYVDHCSIALDAKIMAMTVQNIFKNEGINQVGQVTMERFLGTKK